MKLPDTLFGKRLEEIEPPNMSGYPPIYAHSADYGYHGIRIAKIDCLLIFAKGIVRLPFVIKMIHSFESGGVGPCILYAPNLSTYQRRRLAEENIAFIVSENNLYLPFLGTIISKETSRVKPQLLSAQAQRLFINIIEEHWLNMTVSQLADAMEKSLPSISNYIKEIESIEPSLVRRKGRFKTVVPSFPKDKSELLVQFEGYLSTPKIGEALVGFNGKSVDWLGERALYAGFSALSRYTLLADDEIKTYILPGIRNEDGLLKHHTNTFVVEDVDEAIARIEFWRYFPDFPINGAVDPLSLYLSMHNSTGADDPRVTKALEQTRELIIK
jgi:hypothetical protein